jgi:hypothetical protein
MLLPGGISIALMPRTLPVSSIAIAVASAATAISNVVGRLHYSTGRERLVDALNCY